MRLITLDRRYNYYRYFKYCLDFKGMYNIKQFVSVRELLYTAWGPSIEANLYTSLLVFRSGVNYSHVPWSWSQLDDYHYRVYLVDDIGLAELKLRGVV